LPQTTINKAINDLYANVSTHAFRQMVNILSILCELGSRA